MNATLKLFGAGRKEMMGLGLFALVLIISGQLNA